MSNTSSRQVVIATAVVRNSKGQFLLQKRKDINIPDADGKWEIPGGKINFGEKPEDAAKREVLEETGCVIKIVGLINYVQSTVWRHKENYDIHVVVISYNARLESGDSKPLDPKVTEVGWFTLEEIKEMNTLIGTREFILKS